MLNYHMLAQILGAGGGALNEAGLRPGDAVAAVKNLGEALADTALWKPYVEDIKDPNRRAFTALMLENQRQFFEGMDEATKVTNIGNFDKYAFPLIRTVFPNLIANDLVSVQPMMGPVSLIFFLKYLYGTSKGSTSAGTAMFENTDRNYTSETIEGEVVGTGDGGTQVYNGFLAFPPVRTGTLKITDGTETFTDNGAGVLTGSAAGTGTINYSTGAFALDFNANVGNGTSITASYEYDSENHQNIPQVDLQLTSSPVVATKRKLRARWSMESAQNLQRLQGIDAEAELTAVLAEEIKFEIDLEVINTLFTSATVYAVTTFYNTPPTGVSYNDHKLTIIDKFIEASNQIFTRTKRATANWAVLGEKLSNVVESLPGFKPAEPNGQAGIILIGVLNGRWAIYKNPYFGVNDGLIGYKGTSFLDTGYVFAPYVPLYLTPTIVLDDFQARKGFGTQYGRKMIDNSFYTKLAFNAGAAP